MRFIVLLHIFISILLCQERLDMLINEVLSGSKDSVAIYLPTLERQYPNNPNMLFLQGLLETNGEEAMQIFVELYNNHPTSDFGDDAVMKVSEFYYASGLYIQSATWLKKMPLYYPRSEHIERAVKLLLNSLIVSGNRDTAIHYSKVFKKQFPSLDVDGKINDLLEDYAHAKQSSKNNIKPVLAHKKETSNSLKPSLSIRTEIEKITEGYSLQSGAFSLRANAEKQKLYLMSGGFNAQISKVHKRNILYIVRVGHYNTAQEAEEVGEKIKSLLDLDTFVVQNK